MVESRGPVESMRRNRGTSCKIGGERAVLGVRSLRLEHELRELTDWFRHTLSRCADAGPRATMRVRRAVSRAARRSMGTAGELDTWGALECDVVPPAHAARARRGGARDRERSRSACGSRGAILGAPGARIRRRKRAHRDLRARAGRARSEPHRASIHRRRIVAFSSTPRCIARGSPPPRSRSRATTD